MTDIVRLLARVKELTAFGEAVAPGITTTANVGAYTKGWVKNDSDSDEDDEEKTKKVRRVGEKAT